MIGPLALAVLAVLPSAPATFASPSSGGVYAAAKPRVSDRSVAAALSEAVRRNEVPSPMTLRVEWRVDQRWTTLEIRGTGVAVWNDQAEARLKPAEIVSILQSLDRLGFSSLPLDVGDEEDAEKLQGRVILTIGSRSKTVRELGEEPEKEHPLARFARSVLAGVGEKARGGTTAATLTDGLRKVASGVLDSADFELVAIRRPVTADPANTAWTVRIIGRTARLRPEGAGHLRRLDLSETDWKSLLALLEKADPSRFPQSLWAAEYSELSVKVLDRERNVVARPYLGVTPETHGALQRSFDGTWAAVTDLVRKMEKDGIAEPEPVDEDEPGGSPRPAGPPLRKD